MRQSSRWWPTSLWFTMWALGTAFLAGTLATARVGDRYWLWIGYGLCAVLWLVFVLGDNRAPLVARSALVANALLAAALIGPAPEGTPVILACLGMTAFASLAEIRLPVIVLLLLTVLAVTTLSWWTSTQELESLVADLAALVIVALLGLNRRLYLVQVRQSRELVEQTRLAQAEHARAAALDERARIARELHDVLAHSLGALTVQLEVAEAVLSERGDVEAARKLVLRSRKLAVQGLVEARSAVTALREDVPALAEALAEKVAEHGRDHGVRAGFTTVGPERAIGSPAAVALLRTAREALTNAARHAPGAAVEVRLSFLDGLLRLEVGNDPPARAPEAEPGGHGLVGMRERLTLAGGTLTTGPRAGGTGWLVTAEVPG
ncbi:sensor histidine kinase [Kutzneria albida]|uniref:histidine kinase n=1 Tax=Kutzneria albida DSM 43870 TaxID=1449976 RepID=W5W1C1_9PSEU|nr:histidine kinase [Kutzneria albida]AHH94590.1 histidine kinase [Kutzneria albida DSM 43870]